MSLLSFINSVENRRRLLSQIKTFRREGDKLIKMSFKLKSSPETTLAWRSLQMAKGWLGKSLGELGDTSPYHPADTIANIPPTAEVYDGGLDLSSDKLTNINTMRANIETLIKAINKNISSSKVNVKSLEYVLQHLAEAKMWYGYELEALRHANNNQ